MDVNDVKKMEIERNVDSLIAALKDSNHLVRGTATMALYRIGDVRAVDPFIAALKDSSSLVRMAAAVGLGQIGDARAVEPLIAALKDSSTAVRESVAKALENLKKIDGVQVGKSISTDDALYAFFVRAEESEFIMLDTTTDEKWESIVRRNANMPNAEVYLVREGEWESPKLRSVDEGSKSCIDGIQKYFTAHNLPPMSSNDLARKHLGDMKNPMTGLLVVLVRHSSIR